MLDCLGAWCVPPSPTRQPYSSQPAPHLPTLQTTNLEVGSSRPDWFLIKTAKLHVVAFTEPCALMKVFLNSYQGGDRQVNG